MKKQADGKYYKKIVEWKPRKSEGIAIAFGMLGLGMIFGNIIGFILGKFDPDNFANVSYIILISTIIVFGLNFFESHKRKVKFKRIGK